MPKGIITLPDAKQLVSSFQSQIQYCVEYLEIPQYVLVKDQFLIALKDVHQATRSTIAFMKTTSKPLIILLSLMFRNILILLKIIAEHTIYHAIRGVKEAWRQFMFASRWFVAYQKSLPKSAIYMELGCILLVMCLYALRRYIKRKKYFERVLKWYNAKKSAAIMKYNRIVDRVAQTSMFLASLLPHALYTIAMCSLKWFFPSVVKYFSCQTMASDIISLYIPFVRTILVLHKWRSFGFGLDDKIVSEQNKTTKDRVETGGVLSMFRKKQVGTAYKNSIKSGGKGAEKEQKSKRSRVHLSDEHKQVQTEASRLLQYWVVYALINVTIQTAMLLPILGRALSNMNTKKVNVSSLPWKQRKMGFIDRIKPNAEFFLECKLVFYVWLRMLPTSFYGGTTKRGSEGEAATGSVKSRVSAFEIKSSSAKTARRKQSPLAQNSPIDLMFNMGAPYAIALVSSSSHLLDDTTDGTVSNTPKSLIMRSVAWCRSFLDVMVWTKMIKEKTKLRIIATLVECSDLLPASVSLFMPSYFTSYGIIFVSLLVPSGNSADAYNALKGTKTNSQTVKIMEERILRYLQFWVVQIIVSSILSAFSPILAWIPLSSHLSLLLWAYIQLEGTTIKIYNILEWDLVTFGLLDAHPHHEAGETKDSTTMKLITSITNRIPKSTDDKTDINDTSKCATDASKDDGHDSDIDEQISKTASSTKCTEDDRCEEADNKIKECSPVYESKDGGNIGNENEDEGKEYVHVSNTASNDENEADQVDNDENNTSDRDN